MAFMELLGKEIARSLLQINAIKLEPANPFTWASGWKSPIYCDNRKSLSYPSLRKKLQNAFVQVIEAHFKKPDVIAGVATGAIAHGLMVAEALGLPFVYVRSSAKTHGLGNQVEGDLMPNANVLVIEDLVSTGKSSLAAVDALREAGANIVGMAAIFTYGFPVAQQNFEKANVELHTLSNYATLIDVALESNYINDAHLEALRYWREHPDKWEQ
ncbi:MAG: orotate phosphoribosyltransferase [Bacteroidota bacterium]